MRAYVPPKQSIAGQLFDVGFLLALVFGPLFLPIGLGIAVPSRVEKLPEGVSYTKAADGMKTWQGLTWEKLGQNPTMQAQWTKLGYTKETAADIITQPFDYTIDVAGVAITAGGLPAPFFFLFFLLENKNKTKLAQKFYLK